MDDVYGNKIEYLILYKIVKYMVDNKIFTINIFDIYEQLFKKYDITPATLWNLVKKYFYKEEYTVFLDDNIVSCYEKIPYFLAHFIALDKYENEQLIIEIENLIKECDSQEKINENYIYLIALILKIQQNEKNYDIEYYIAQFLSSIISYKKIIFMLNNTKDQVYVGFLKEDIKHFIDNNIILKLLYLNDISTFEEFVNAPLIYKLIGVSGDLSKSTFYIKMFSKEMKKEIINGLEKIFMSVTPREEKVINLRYGLIDGSFKTLEEIGIIYGVSRERIRQIEKKALTKIIKKVIKNKYIYSTLYEYFIKEKGYFFLDELINYFNDIKNIRIFCLILDMLNLGNYKYDMQLVYDKKIDENELVAKIISLYPIAIPEKEFESFSVGLKLILKDKYEKRCDVYAKKISLSKIILKILKDHFNCKINFKNNDLDKIKKIAYDEYYYNLNLDEHSFKAHLERLQYYPIGNSIYGHVDRFPNIPSQLLNKILSYLENIKSSVSYSVLYDKFNNELQEMSIDNVDYFKSIIDLVLPEHFVGSKSFIKPADMKMSSVEEGINKIRSFESFFEYRDVEDKLSTYTKNSINIYIARELDNGLIALKNKKYIYYKNVNVSEKDKITLEEVMDKILTDNDHMISVNSVYVNLYYNEPELLKRLGEFNNAYNLFSLLKAMFKEKFSFSRPIISRNNNEKNTCQILLLNNLRKYSELSFDDIKNEIQKLKIWYEKNKYKFIEMLSDDFLLVEENKFINKNKINIYDNDLSEIKSILNMLLRRDKEINSEKFKVYNVFPKLKYSWNKYLLLGIIKSYFSDEYEISFDNEKGMHEYTVRRIINE